MKPVITHTNSLVHEADSVNYFLRRFHVDRLFKMAKVLLYKTIVYIRKEFNEYSRSWSGLLLSGSSNIPVLREDIGGEQRRTELLRHSPATNSINSNYAFRAIDC